MAVKHARVKRKSSRVWVKLAVALGVLAVLGLVFAASVGIGKLLLKQAEKYPAEQENEQITVPPQEIIPVRVPRIKAHSYTIGARYSSYVYSGITQVCAPLRDKDGNLNFDSRVCKQVGWNENGRVDLSVNAWELHENGLYLCTYIPITGFEVEDAVLSELTLSYEASLIAEAAESGVDEIFLTGLTPTQANIGQVAAYIERVKLLCGDDCAIGVLVTPELFLMAEYDVYLAAQLMRVCDFLVMDLRDLPTEEILTEPDGELPTGEEQTTEGEQGMPARQITVTYVLENMQYDLQRYSPRLALTDAQTDALDLIMTKGYGNWLIMQTEE
ncbi:MAG: hypothetical protein IKW24_05400 [Clostridia bacterium]|nr:hypothetical protein [Clostridia bacterium]